MHHDRQRDVLLGAMQGSTIFLVDTWLAEEEAEFQQDPMALFCWQWTWITCEVPLEAKIGE